jgi:2-polyprenyl-3-methyl-5-hydroxy-6-metoxy-1,4-benzoquinol methylase
VQHVPGTRGYEKVVGAFSEATKALEFDVVNRPYLHLLPSSPARVLDAGAGIGQNAAELARRGHAVIAVEPLAEFVNVARSDYANTNVTWVEDSLPDLAKLGEASGQFDFILLQAVWQHLDSDERILGMARLAGLLDEGGICAMSLRNGPAGAGTHIFPTDDAETVMLARRNGLEVVLQLENQPSVMKNKHDVTWTHMAFRRPDAGAFAD